MRTALHIFLLVALAVVGAGCSSQEDAKTVAQNFWDALSDHDIEKARSYATKESAGSLDMAENKEDEDVTVQLGEAVEQTEGYHIATSLLVVSPDGEEMNMPLQTVVVQEEGAWKVDASATFMSMFGGAMEQMMEELGSAMGDAMEDLGESMEAGMGDMMEEMSEAMEEAVEETEGK